MDVRRHDNDRPHTSLSTRYSPTHQLRNHRWRNLVPVRRQGFPGIGWSDLPATVVSWFLEVTAMLVKSRKRNVTMRSLDGPYEVRIFAKRWDAWKVELVEDRPPEPNIKQFNFTPDPFIRSLITCADELVDQAPNYGWISRDIDSITSQRKRLVYYSEKKRWMPW